MSENNKMHVGRYYSYYRPYHIEINNKGYDISSIHIYNETGKVYTTSGWFEDEHTGEDVAGIRITAPILKRKENFNIKTNYIIPIKKDKYDSDQKCELYINESDAKFTMIAQHQIWYESDRNTAYQHIGMITIDHINITVHIYDSTVESIHTIHAAILEHEFNEHGIFSADAFTISNILKHYTITPKEITPCS